MKINVISKVTDIENDSIFSYGIFTYESDIIPIVGDYLLFGDCKTFKVNERAIMITKDNVVSNVDVYGVIL